MPARRLPLAPLTPVDSTAYPARGRCGLLPASSRRSRSSGAPQKTLPLSPSLLTLLRDSSKG
eukprot:656437-Prorocentrum_lima.AAC.1